VARWYCRVYRMLLYAYPADFRRRYGGEMAQVFGDCWRVWIIGAGPQGQVWYRLAGRPIVPLCEMQGIAFRYS
jgi:hypothetical protein